MAEKFPSVSPYNYTLNNPIKLTDPDGRGPCGDKPCPKKEESSAFDTFLESLPDVSLEISVSVGPQAGITVGEIVKVDLSVMSVEVLKDKSSIESGKFESTKKLGTKEISGDEKGVKTGGVKVSNQASISILGFGGGVGQEQQIDGDLQSSDYKTFIEKSTSYNGLFSKVKEETDAFGNTTTKQESGFEIGLKFILGVELKFQIDQ